jgi:hypothetical protein
MIHHQHIVAELGGGEELRFDLIDLDVQALDPETDGAEACREFARLRMQAMGYPDLLVACARYRIEP